MSEFPELPTPYEVTLSEGQWRLLENKATLKAWAEAGHLDLSVAECNRLTEAIMSTVRETVEHWARKDAAEAAEAEQYHSMLQSPVIGERRAELIKSLEGDEPLKLPRRRVRRLSPEEVWGMWARSLTKEECSEALKAIGAALTQRGSRAADD